jgi:tetratricopeptide (TPR) repeat protein
MVAVLALPDRANNALAERRFSVGRPRLLVLVMLFLWSVHSSPVLAGAEEKWQARGDKAFSAQKWDEAIKWYSRILDADFKSVRALFPRGICYYRMGNLFAARDDFRRLTLLDSKHLPGHRYLGLVNAKRKDYRAALVDFLIAAKLSKQGRDYLAAGKCAYDLGKYGDAIEYCNEAIRYAEIDRVRRASQILKETAERISSRSSLMREQRGLVEKILQHR